MTLQNIPAKDDSMSTTRDYLEFLNQKIDIAPVDSEEEYQAAGLIESLMQSHGLETKLQDFEISGSGQLPYQILAILMFIGVFLAGLLDTPAVTVGVVLLVAAFLLIALNYLQIIDLFRGVGAKRHSQNVIGIHRATGPLVVKGMRPIVVVAHYDTPRENMLYSPPFSRWQVMLRKYAPQCTGIAALLGIIQTFSFVPEVVRHVFWIVAIIAALPCLIVGIAGVQQQFAPCTEGSNDNKSGMAALLGVMNMVHPGEDAASGYDRPRTVHEVESKQVAVSADDLEEDVNEEQVDRPAAVSEESSEETEKSEEFPVNKPVDEVGVPAAPIENLSATQVVPSTLEEAETSKLNTLKEETPTKVDNNFVQAKSHNVSTSIHDEIRKKNIRHGEEALRALHILPDSCEIIYIKPTEKKSITPSDESSIDFKETSDDRVVKDHEEEPSSNELKNEEPLADNKDWIATDEREPDNQVSTTADLSESFKGFFNRVGAAFSSKRRSFHEAATLNRTQQDSPVIDVPTVSEPEVRANIPLEKDKSDTLIINKEDSNQNQQNKETISTEPKKQPQQDGDKTLPFVPTGTFSDGQKVDTSIKKDVSGLDKLANDETVINAQKSDMQPKPQMPDDPNWGKSSFKPTMNGVSRRAVLFDLPDPTVEDIDPLSDDLGSTAHNKPTTESSIQNSSTPRTTTPSTTGSVRSHQPLNRAPSPAKTSIASFEDIDASLGQIKAPQPLDTIYTPVKKDTKSERARRKKSLFPHKVKKDEPKESMGEWLGVGDDFDAKTNGREIGTWQNFTQDENKKNGKKKWKGGATLRSSFKIVGDETKDDVRVQEDLNASILQMDDNELVAHDIWFVALGASYANHAGMEAFLSENRKSIRGSFVINLDCVGAGDLSILTNEGLERTRRADRRMGHLITQVAEDLHIKLRKSEYNWDSTDATPALRASMRAATICGLTQDGEMAFSQTPEGESTNINASQVVSVAELVAEVIRRS
jgi:hypothetical protein